MNNDHSTCIAFGPYDGLMLTLQEVAYAQWCIAQERERCAKIAELQWRIAHPKPSESISALGYHFMEIARKIRSGE